MSVGTAIRNPRTFVAGKYRTTKSVLFDPAGFYEELSTSSRLSREIVVVFVVGVIGSVGSYFASQQIMANIYTGSAIGGADAEFGVSGEVGLQIQGFALQGLVGAFLLWVGLATILYAVSWLYSDRGSYFGMVKHTAWAMLPMFVGNLIKTVALVAASWNAWDRGVIEAQEGDFVQTAEQVRAFLWQQILSEPVAIGGIVVAALFVIWTGYIAAHGVAKVRDIPLEDAYRVAAVGVVGYLLWVAYDVLGIVGVL